MQKERSGSVKFRTVSESSCCFQELISPYRRLKTGVVPEAMSYKFCVPADLDGIQEFRKYTGNNKHKDLPMPFSLLGWRRPRTCNRSKCVEGIHISLCTTAGQPGLQKALR